MLTEKEKLILKEIEKNPLIKQDELAQKFSMTRIAIAVHIGNLQKKGFIIGRGYFLNYPSKVTILGGINLAFNFKSKEKYKVAKNNLGVLNTSIRGTAYNIFNNLSKWNNEINYISFIGEDFYGDEIVRALQRDKIENIELFRVKTSRTGIYTSFNDEEDNFLGAILSMELFENLTLQEFKPILPKLQNSTILYIDANYPLHLINEIANINQNSYVIFNTITSLKTYEHTDIKFKYNFLCTSLEEANKMFVTKLKTDDELYEYIKSKGIISGIIYSKNKTLVFEENNKLYFETKHIREYYISRVIELKKTEKTLNKKNF